MLSAVHPQAQEAKAASGGDRSAGAVETGVSADGTVQSNVRSPVSAALSRGNDATHLFFSSEMSCVPGLRRCLLHHVTHAAHRLIRWQRGMFAETRILDLGPFAVDVLALVGRAALFRGNAPLAAKGVCLRAGLVVDAIADCCAKRDNELHRSA